jgi:hypothetical protein
LSEHSWERPGPPRWVEDVEILDEFRARVIVKRRDGKRVVYEIPRKPLTDLTNGHGTNGDNEAADSQVIGLPTSYKS